jgi:DNA invertase Pin-like site-specific DNA recombinase
MDGMNNTRIAVCYTRVSTEGQATEGVSLDAQAAKSKAWTEANGYRLAATFTEAMSGGRADNRPQLQAALAHVCKVKGALIVYSLSRLARSTRDAIDIAERLDRAGADLVSLSERIDTTSAAGKMVFRLLAVMAEFERDIISERTTAAMSHLRTQGRRISGAIPFGYRLAEDGNNLHAVPSEQEAIAFMSKLRAGGKSLLTIAAELQRRGVATKTGTKWSSMVVWGILRRAALPSALAALARPC